MGRLTRRNPLSKIAVARPLSSGSGRHGKGKNPVNGYPVFLSQALSEWFRHWPHLRMRCVVPVQRDGNTVELHAWYDAHLFPAFQRPKPEGQQPA